MLPDRVSNPGPLTYESGALPIALRGPAALLGISCLKFGYLGIVLKLPLLHISFTDILLCMKYLKLQQRHNEIMSMLIDESVKELKYYQFHSSSFNNALSTLN